MKVTLTEFNDSHLGLLRDWLAQNHVKRWYPDPDAYATWAADPPAGGAQALIEVANNPAGYVRWQLVSREILESVGLVGIPDNSADVDILIGEHSYTSKGIGPNVLMQLISRLAEQGDVPLIGLTTSVDNKHAQQAFQKAGFDRIAEYSPDGFGDCYLFAKTLDR